jgi:hypothetical protein
MQFEESFVDNYLYNEDVSPIVGGYPIQLLSNDTLDSKFDNMAIPIGLVLTKNDITGGASQHYKLVQHSIDDIIDDNLFDNLINKISYREHKNTTRKNYAGNGSHNTTKKSK